MFDQNIGRVTPKTLPGLFYFRESFLLKYTNSPEKNLVFALGLILWFNALFIFSELSAFTNSSRAVLMQLRFLLIMSAEVLSAKAGGLLSSTLGIRGLKQSASSASENPCTFVRLF